MLSRVQGYPFPPLFANFVIGTVMKITVRSCHDGFMDTSPNRRLSYLEYIDDAVLLGVELWSLGGTME